MEKTLFIIGFIGVILAMSDGEGFPFINYMGALLVLACICLYHVTKEK